LAPRLIAYQPSDNPYVEGIAVGIGPPTALSYLW